MRFSFADLQEANLADADLSSTELRAANLTRADLRRAEMSNTNVSDAHLVDTNFSKAMPDGAIFGNVNLALSKGLETCLHSGPSIIGIDTLMKSNGEIPESFLRGCGVPEQFVTYGRSLTGKAIEFYSCFISYSIQSGRKIHEQIDEAIRVYDRLLLILSDHSMNSSWVESEIAKARKREVREKRQMLFPVRLVDFEVLRDWEHFDADTGKDSAREIREYFIPDFSNWKNHDSYKKAFDRLLRDLKSKPDVPATV